MVTTYQARIQLRNFLAVILYFCLNLNLSCSCLTALCFPYTSFVAAMAGKMTVVYLTGAGSVLLEPPHWWQWLCSTQMVEILAPQGY